MWDIRMYSTYMAIPMPYGLITMILFQIIHNWQTSYFLTK